MSVIQRPFGGLLTDPDPIQVPSGSADIALNVTVRDGKLAKRHGFAEWEDNVTGGADVLFLDVVHYADGSAFVIAKLDDGKLYQRRSSASSFTQLSAGHSTTAVGWSFFWCNRWFYIDSKKTARVIWSGSAFSVKLAGFTTPTFGNLC